MTELKHEIEERLAMHGVEIPDKNVKRTCGNCAYFVDRSKVVGTLVVGHCLLDQEKTTEYINSESDDYCYHHHTNAELYLLNKLNQEALDRGTQRQIEDWRKKGTGFCEGCKNIAALSILERLAVYDDTGKFCGIRSCFLGDECFHKLVKLFTTNGGIANG